MKIIKKIKKMKRKKINFNLKPLLRTKPKKNHSNLK